MQDLLGVRLLLKDKVEELVTLVYPPCLRWSETDTTRSKRTTYPLIWINGTSPPQLFSRSSAQPKVALRRKVRNGSTRRLLFRASTTRKRRDCSFGQNEVRSPSLSVASSHLFQRCILQNFSPSFPLRQFHYPSPKLTISAVH